jgi:hypothetical protein
MGVIFSASLSQDLIKARITFNPSNDVSRKYNVYETYLGPHFTTYWNDWGGWYDNIIVSVIEVYIGRHYLIQVNSLSDCCIQEWSIYNDIDKKMAYINIPQHPWLYNEVTTNFRHIVSFLSGPKNQNNPSDDMFNGEHWPVRLETPKITVKLSDVINGLTKYSTFDFTLHNDDGYFDDLEASNFFNGPSYIKKTWKENPEFNDFLTIRSGKVETIKIDEKNITINSADLFRTFDEPLCQTVDELFTTAEENTDQKLPLVYGTVTIPLIKIGDLKYVAGENISSVSAVYDKDGNSLSFNFNNGIITTSVEANYAIIKGNDNNKIGHIVTDVISKKSRLGYINSFWDMEETNRYRNNSPQINIALTDGTVNTALKNILGSDMVFLIQKNDGRFTLREWGKTYNTFTIAHWEITKFPTKDYNSAQKNYQSSCIINYNYNFQSKIYNDSLLYNENEYSAEDLYGKLVRKEFNTYLTNRTDATKLSANLSKRFYILKETIQVAVGKDTSEINLLDTIQLELTINGRVFSKYTKWIVVEMDPAQDTLTLEAV